MLKTKINKKILVIEDDRNNYKSIIDKTLNGILKFGKLFKRIKVKLLN